MIYTFISSGTDNGKQFHTPEENKKLAIKYKEINREPAL